MRLANCGTRDLPRVPEGFWRTVIPAATAMWKLISVGREATDCPAERAPQVGRRGRAPWIIQTGAQSRVSWRDVSSV